MHDVETPVLIVGGGPVGLLAARLLGRRGVGSLLVEKHAMGLEAPKAHALNPRSQEILHAAGLPMDEVLSGATPAAEGGQVRFVTSLAAPGIGGLPYERQDEAVRELTPWPLVNIEQPRLEAILERAAGATPGVEIRRGLEWRSSERMEDGIVSTLTDRSSGRNLRIASRWLIAADGAGSPVREHMGIAMDGPAELQRNVMIHFEADLRPVVGDRPAMLYFLVGPDAGGVLIAYDIGRTWVLMHPFRPDHTPDAYFTEEVCRELVRAAIGAPVADLAIRGVRIWSMSAQVARSYRDGQVFLAGDAAHRFPPTGGLGLNTGLADVDNLTWKIAAVEAGWAGAGLLESYEPERRAVALANMGQSRANAARMGALFEALGHERDRPLDAKVFAARLADPAARAEIDAAVAFQAEHFDSLGLQLGYVYGEPADEAASVSAYVPRAVPGARLPHLVLADGRSTLDLLDGTALTLICGPAASWATTVSKAAGVVLAVEGRDFAVTDWMGRLGLELDGGLLARPDGHILAVARDASDARSMGEALTAVLHTA